MKGDWVMPNKNEGGCVDEGFKQKWWIPKTVTVVDDCFVFKGCKVRYHPHEKFAEFRSEHKENLELTPPYIHLVNALNTFLSINRNVLPDNMALPLSEWDSGINNWKERLAPLIEWIEAWGPLGIMLHECSRITYVRDLKKKKKFYRSITADFWTPNEGWDRYDQQNEIDQEKANIGAETKIYSDIATTGSNIQTTIEKHMARFMKNQVAANHEIEQYFSIDPDTSYEELPAPLTGSFFNCYKEPVHLFINSAIFLKKAIMQAAVDDEDLRTKEEGLFNLRHLAAAATFMPISEQISKKVTRQRLSVTFRAPSLYTAMAAWAYADSLAPQKVFLCGQCKKLHASSATKSSFCSESCRKLNFIQKKRRAAKAIKLHNEGRTIAEIAILLGRPYEEVASWFENN